MTTNNVVSELGEKWWPLPPEKFFTAQRAPDMWFGDELPPTLQAELASPLVTQSKLMVQMGIMQNLALGERKRVMQEETQRFVSARSRVGKRAKTKRH
jgi:hypothetical protein